MKNGPMDKKRMLRAKDHLTRPPRLEGKVKNAMMNPVRKKPRRGGEMKTSVKAARKELVPAVQGRIEKICAQLEKLAHVSNPDALMCDIEIVKTTKHHRHGKVFRAEINFAINGKRFRAVAEGETVLSTLASMEAEIKREIVHYKHKEQSSVRRQGARLKDSKGQSA